MENKNTVTAQESRASLQKDELNERELARLTSDITDKQVDDIAALLRDYDEQQLKYMIFAAQTCIASANLPEEFKLMKEAAINFVADLYRAIDGCYN